MENKIEIVQGEGRVLYLGINEDNGSPYDLSTATAIRVMFRNIDGTYTNLTMATGAIAILGDAHRGEITATITAAQSALLAVCDSADFQGDVTLGTSAPRRIIWEGILTVVQQKGV